jgi:hypothetical protein
MSWNRFRRDERAARPHWPRIRSQPIGTGHQGALFVLYMGSGPFDWTALAADRTVGRPGAVIRGRSAVLPDFAPVHDVPFWITYH